MKKVMKKVTLSLLTFNMLMINLVMPVNALTKEETVYTKLDSNGNVINTIVNEQIKTSKKGEINDYSILKDIINISGDESFTTIDNNIKWNAKGKDIFYQGKTNKELPISLNVTYKLNGDKKDVKDMIGKSGKVEITLKYKNNNPHLVKVNGKYQTLFTPFTVMMGTVINNESAKDIEVTNGKVLSNGEQNIIIGLAAPGLYESLDVDSLKGLDTIKIEYETSSFELSSIYSSVTSKLIDNSDLKVFDELDKTYSSINTLEKSMNEIEKGAKELKEGSATISDGTSLISSNLELVVTNLNDIKNGVISVDEGLDQVLYQLNAASTKLKGNEGISKIKGLIETNKSTINKLSASDAKIKTTYETYNLDKYTDEQIKLMDASGNLCTVKYEYENHYESNEQLIVLLSGNNDALNQLLLNLDEISKQLTSLTEALTKIKAGTSKLNNGTTQLYEGVKYLSSKTSELSNGMKTLDNGIVTLSKGVTKFNNEGIKKLTNTINNNVKTKTNIIKELKDLSNGYTSFAGKNNSDSTTKFVLVIDSVKMQKGSNSAQTSTSKTTFWYRLTHLFSKK